MTEQKPQEDSAHRWSHNRIFTASLRTVNRGRRAAGILTYSETRSVKRRLWWALAVVVILSILVATIGNYISTVRTPTEAIEKHFNNLRDGRYFRAMDRSAYGDDSVVFLKNSIYRQSPGRVESYSIEEIQESDNTATAQVKVKADGKEQLVHLNVVKDHKTGIFNDAWHLAEPGQKLLSVENSFPLDEISINGYPVDLPDTGAFSPEESSYWKVALLPGKFEFGMPKDSYYSVVGGSYSVGVGFNQDSLKPLQYKLRPSYRMWSETDQEIDKWVQKCMNSRSLSPEGCPASKTPAEKNITEVEWNLISRPVMYLEQDSQKGDTWHASKYKPAEFTVTYEKNGKKITEKISTPIDATVVSSGKSASIEVKAGEPSESSASPSAKGTDR